MSKLQAAKPKRVDPPASAARDRLAEKAMLGLLQGGNVEHRNAAAVANTAYTIADAMLKEREKRTPLPKPQEVVQGEPVEIDFPEYHSFGMGCGLEDRGITDRYAAMEYGWEEALDRMAEELEHLGPLYQCPRLPQDATEQINALQAELAEAQANDRTAMCYLSEIRAIVGGKDFPEMVRNVAALAEAAVVRHKAVEACVKKFCKKDDKK